MDWYNQWVEDLFIFNMVIIGLATLSTILTKRYGIFSLRTIGTVIGLYAFFLVFITLSPYYDREVFNSLFMIAPVIIVRVYYDIRFTYILMIFIIFASQIHHVNHLQNPIDYAHGLLYLFLSAVIILIPKLKSKTVHTFVLFSASYLASIASMFILPDGTSEILGMETFLWGINIFTLTWIASRIVPVLMEFMEMIYTKKDMEIDALTGVYNRLSFNQHMDMLFLKECTNQLSSFSILFLDMNKYKEINDTYGHHVGDHVLMRFAKQLENELQGEEKVFRYGGDEFVVYTPKTGDELKRLISNLEQNVQNRTHPIDGHTIGTSYSLGVAEYPFTTSNVLEIVKIADSRMFMNKRSTSSQS